MMKIKKLITFLLFSLIGAIFLFLLFEGLASTLFVIADLLSVKPFAEKRHTQYDPDLGWINIPNLYIADMYGPKVSLKTNSQAFRNNQDFGVAVPPDKIRIICSGDSFTFGYGVDNDHTWCQLLADHNPRLESVNMGQGGYGIDQAYLWYRRDGTKLDHDLHLLAFVTDDFRRIQGGEFAGYGKPVLEFRENGLVTENIPVPKLAAYKRWLDQHRTTIRELKSVRLLSELISPSPELLSSGEKNPRQDDQTRKIVIAIFKELHRLNQAKKSTLVLVYLPSATDYFVENSQVTLQWQQFLRDEAAKNDLLFIDLVNDFRKLTYRQVVNLFILPGKLDYAYAAWHYNEAGNAYIANLLYARLLTIPEIADKLRQQF